MGSFNVEEHIPAFSMWKMLNETVPVLRKGDCSEASIKKLASIIQSKEGSSIFICQKDQSVLFQQFQNISDNYKSFTTWILGQFFYLLSLEKFENVHSIIIDVQLYILNQLSITQLHVYQDLTEQYMQAFLNLLQYFQGNTDNNLILKIFLPDNYKELEEKLDLQQVFVEISSKSQCITTLKMVMKFIKLILKECFIFCSFGRNTFQVLDGLLVLLGQSEELLRVNTAEIFIEIIQISRKEMYNCNLNVIKRFMEFSSLFEQYIYNVYDSQIIIKDCKLMEHFECLVVSYLELHKDWNFKNIDRVQEYIFKTQFEFHIEIKPTFNVLVHCNNNIKDITDIETHKIIFQAAKINQVSLFCYLKSHILEELLKYESRSLDIKAYNEEVSPTYFKLHGEIFKNIAELNCQKDCSFEKFVIYFKYLSNMLIDIKLNVLKHREHNQKVLFFEEINLIHEFLVKFANHQDICKNFNVPLKQIFDFLITFTLVAHPKNIECIFVFLTTPFLNNLNVKHESNNVEFIGGNWELKKYVQDFCKYLLSQTNQDMTIFLEYMKQFFVIISTGLFDVVNCQINNIEMCFGKIVTALLDLRDFEITSLVSNQNKKVFLLMFHIFLGVRNCAICSNYF